MRKRIIAVALAVMTGATFSKINAQELTSRLDTLSYAVGLSQTQGLVEYLKNRLNINTTFMDDFVQGLREGVAARANEQQQARYADIQIGQQIGNQMLKGINKDLFGDDATKSISLDLFMQGFICGATGQQGLMTLNEANEKASRLMESIKEENAMAEYGPNKKAGEDFLAENAKKADVKILDCGVQYKVIKQGTGAIPTKSQKVKVHYEGRLIDGTIFDSSYNRKSPTDFRCDQVIKGWTEALSHMPVGSTWEVYIPQELAYGARKMGNDIKPFSMLIFKIELLDILDK